jgi:hypothetical protein
MATTTTELYEQDFYLWCLETCAALGAREFEAVDLTHLIDEVRSLALREKRAIGSHLEQVLLHLLKWCFQLHTQVDARHWADAIVEHRQCLADQIEDSPSLSGFIPLALPKAYAYARTRAQLQTGLPLATFPPACPWELADVLNVEFWPDAL